MTTDRKSENQEFKPGDVVRLRAGGPRMTVESMADDGRLLCVWFAGEVGAWSGPTRDHFIPQALEHLL